MSRRQDAFTLVEMLVVITMVGILAAIAIQRFGGTKDRTYVTAMQSDLRNLVTAEAEYYADSARYTADLTALTFRQTAGVNAPIIAAGTGFWTATVTHNLLAGHVCGVSVNTTNPVSTAAGEGTPACN